MKSGRKLWQNFGPVLVAVLLAALLFVIPWQGAKPNQKVVKKAAVSLSANIYRGEKIKKAALESGYVPIIGSSELTRMDPLHPSVLAEKYNRGYQTLLLGGPGSQSLNHFFTIQTMKSQLKNKKVVFIVSPQWFTKAGKQFGAFGYYYSSLQAIDWILQAKDTKANRYAAKQLLTKPSGQSGAVMSSAIKKIAAGRKITKSERVLLQIRQQILRNEDNFFSSFTSAKRLKRIQQGEKELPSRDNEEELINLANRLGKKHTGNNRFNINNSFYSGQMIHQRIGQLKNSQTKFDYRQSPEYGDFQLVLNQFAELNSNVTIVLPPINEKWAAYTGLSMTMWRQTIEKIKYQLQQQGFYNVIDLSEDGNKPYYMEDTIHLGWAGWLKMDQKVNPFLTKSQPAPSYHINNYFFSKKWQNELYKVGKQ